MDNPKRYCSVCGAELKIRIVGAEKYCNRSFQEVAFIQIPYDAYNKHTGKRNLITEFRCPKKMFWNNHDNYGRLTREQEKIINE